LRRYIVYFIMTRAAKFAIIHYVNIFSLIAVMCVMAAPARGYEEALSEKHLEGTLEASKMQEIFDRYLATLQVTDPEAATRIGVHEADKNLTSRNLEQEEARINTTKGYLADLSKIDKSVLNHSDFIDLTLFQTRLEMDVYVMEVSKPLLRRPQFYMSALDAIYGILNKDFDAYMLRAHNALSRLKQFPQILSQAEHNLTTPPKIWVEQAIIECDDADTSFADLTPMFKRMVGLDASLQGEVDRSVQNARQAISHYRAYLKDTAIKQASGDFRIGDEAYGYYLARWHHVGFNPADAEAIARKTFKSTRSDFLTELAQTLGRKEVAPEDFDEAIFKLSKDHPRYDDIISTFQQEMERAYRHFDRYHIAPVPKERIRIVEPPSYLTSKTPFVFYSRPYPLDLARVAELYVNLPPKKTPEKKLEAAIRAMFNFPYIEMAVTQEVYPGRHLQDSESLQTPRPRHISEQPFLSNGWAAYAQLLGMEQGYYTNFTAKLVYLRWELVRAARAYVDAALHTKDIDYDQAMTFLTKEAGLSAGQARSEILRVSLNPTEGLSYIIGRDEILRVRKKYRDKLGDDFDLRDFHRRLLQLGNVPITMLDGELAKSYEESKSPFDMK